MNRKKAGEFSPVVELWDVSDLIPYEQNAKKHPQEQIDKLSRAITKFGWTQPIVVWTNGEIIAGHGRRLAALNLGLKKVPVVVRSDLTQAEAAALRLSDNRVASDEYDQALLQDEIVKLTADLMEGGSDIEIGDIGFDEKELDFSTADLGQMNEDFMTDDVGEAVEEQRAQNEQNAKDLDQSAAPVGDALGFKRVTISQSREIRNYMARVEAAVEATGPEALMEFFRRNLGDAT